MNSHDVGRGRGGVPAALENVMADLVVVAVDSDRLYPLRLSHEIAQASASSDPAHIISSLHGHDGFLIEIGQVGRIVRETLSRTRGR
jgi:homoserine O-acetyltransferase